MGHYYIYIYPVADSLKNSGGAKLNLSELVFDFIIEYYSTHTRTTISWVYLSNSIFFSDLMTISLNRDIVKAINLDNVLERWMMQKKRVIPC